MRTPCANYLLFAIVVVLILLFDGCMVTYGNDVSRQFTRLTPDTSDFLPLHKSVLLYFEGEPIKFEYEKVGIVEVKGNQTASTSDLLDHLKYEALKYGAQAVISVKDGYATRTEGLLFSKTPPTEYSSHIFTGIAVKLKDTDHYRVLVNEADTNFIKKVQGHDTKNANRAGNEFGASVVLMLVLIGVGIYAVNTK